MRVSYCNRWCLVLLALTLMAGTFSAHAVEKIKPFVLAAVYSGDVNVVISNTRILLKKKGFEIVGEYTPYNGARIIAVTSPTLKKAAASHDRAGYIAVQRVSITELKGVSQVAFTNPVYMGAAYQIEMDLGEVRKALATALGEKKEFGPPRGLTIRKMRKYHYTFGMEYFDEPYDLAEYDDHKQAVAAVEKGLAAKTAGTTKVYRVDIPGTKQTLFGVGMASGVDGNQYMDEKFIMTEIDFKPLRSTAHLPYEILVRDNEIEALHARFRIAMSFPDLSMMGAHSFMNIMPTPDAIDAALTEAVGGTLEEEDF